MTTSLKDSNTAIKTYWAILNRLLYNKMIPAIPPLLVYGSFILDYWTKATFLLLYTHLLQTTVCYLPFYIRPAPE